VSVETGQNMSNELPTYPHHTQVVATLLLTSPWQHMTKIPKVYVQSSSKRYALLCSNTSIPHVSKLWLYYPHAKKALRCLFLLIRQYDDASTCPLGGLVVHHDTLGARASETQASAATEQI
jgi:hypothetical protein